MKIVPFLTFIFLIHSCSQTKKIPWPERKSALTGSMFYKTAAPMLWKARDSFALKELLAGNTPAFLKNFISIHVSDTARSGRLITATYYVSPDYLSIGTDADWARINITPRVAQRVADTLHCFLPTKKISDDIYTHAKVKLEPVPMYAFRDSTVTMWQHHLIIEGQRQGRKGLVAGIKKDVIITSRIKDATRVAIYGWHKPDGKPIQPVYTGHVYWWVDYSQGIRLVYRKMKVNNKWMDYKDVLSDPDLRILLCDEENCDFYRYSY